MKNIFIFIGLLFFIGRFFFAQCLSPNSSLETSKESFDQENNSTSRVPASNSPQTERAPASIFINNKSPNEQAALQQNASPPSPPNDDTYDDYKDRPKASNKKVVYSDFLENSFLPPPTYANYFVPFERESTQSFEHEINMRTVSTPGIGTGTNSISTNKEKKNHDAIIINKQSTKNDHTGNRLAVIAGTVPALVGYLGFKQFNPFQWFIDNAYASLCTAQVELYKLNDNGTLKIPALGTVDVNYKGQFDFGPAKNWAIGHQDDFKYYLRLKADGCTVATNLSRFVANLDHPQDLTFSTTLLSQTRLLATYSSRNEWDRNKIKQFTSKLEGFSSIQETYDQIDSDDELKDDFQTLFTINHNELVNVSPQIIAWPSIPNALEEQTTYDFSIEAQHWHENYNTAYAWTWDGQLVSSLANVSITPSKNQQGLRTLSLKIGQSDGNGSIDESKPFLQQSYSIQVTDTHPLTLPSANVINLTNGYSNQTTIDLQVVTGQKLENCQTFSSFAITENISIPSEESFTFHCEQDLTQTVSFQLADSTNGSRSLYLWIKDANNNISSDPLQLNFVLDTQAPPAPAVALGGPSIISKNLLTLNATHCQASPFLLLSQTQTLPSADAPGWFNCTATFDHPLFGSPTTGDYELYVFAKDVAGNISIPQTISYTFDDIAPLIELHTNLNAAYQGGAALPLSLSTSDSHGISQIIIEYTIDGSNFVELSTINGTVSDTTIVLPQLDAQQFQLRLSAFDQASPANHDSILTTPLTIDSTPPQSPLVTISSPLVTSALNISLTPENCNDTPFILVSKTSATPAQADSAWQSCQLSPNSLTYNLTAQTAEGDVPLYIFAKDSVGNISSALELNLTYDITAPNIALLTQLDGLTLRGSSDITLNFNITDLNDISNAILQYSNDGINYSDIDILTAGQSSYNWTIPSTNTTTAKIRLIAQDKATPANESSLYSTTFAIDSQAPINPTITVTSGLITNSTTIFLSATSCLDTPKLKLQEDLIPPDADDPDWLACSTQPNAFTYELIIPAQQGTNTFYAFAQDDVGNISDATTLEITYDSIAPTLAFQNTFPSVLKGETQFQVSYSASDIGNISELTLQYSIDEENYNDIAQLDPQQNSYHWTIPDIDHPVVSLRLRAYDYAAPTPNSSSIVSSNFAIDSTAPLLTISAPLADSYLATTINLSGNCEAGASLLFSGDLLADITMTCPVNGTYSRVLNLTHSEGAKTISVRASDAAGNSTELSRSFIKDTVAPFLTRTNGASPFLSKQNTATWSGTCEGNLPIKVSGATTTSISCIAGFWSWTTPVSTQDGIYDYSLTQTDLADNTSSALPLRFIHDTLAPSFTVAQSGPLINNQTALTLNGTCEGNHLIRLSNTEEREFFCNAGQWSFTSDDYDSDGERIFEFVHSDGAGNTSTLHFSWTKSTAVPDLALDQAHFISNSDFVIFNGVCEDGVVLKISGDVSDQIDCDGALWSWQTPVTTSDGVLNITFVQTNLAGNSTSVAASWRRLTQPPTLTNLSSLHTPTTTSNYIATELAADSGHSTVNLTHVCFKINDPTPPTLNAECWIPVTASDIGQTPTAHLAIANYSLFLGWNQTDYSVYAWVKDAAQNISSNQNSDGVDRFTTSYIPASPPELTNVLVANSDALSQPLTSFDTTFSAGDDVFIKWTASDSQTLPAASIKLEYSLNGEEWFVVANDLNNSVNGACTLDHPNTALDDEASGCYLWEGGAPVNSSFKLRLSVVNQANLNRIVNSQDLNSYPIQIHAGNTSLGLDGSAQSAIFFSVTENPDYPAGQTLAVNSKGIIFFLDYYRGVLYIDPANGEQRVLLPMTGTSGGDGGAVQNATARLPVQIAMDFSDRLLVVDYNRIRRIDTTTTPMTIETIIGGGSNKDDLIENPLDLHIAARTRESTNDRRRPLIVMPNGDLYFTTHSPTTGQPIRRYRKSLERIESLYLQGQDNSSGEEIDLASVSHYSLGIEYNPSNGQIIGMLSSNRAADKTCNSCGFSYYSFPELQSQSPSPPTNGYASIINRLFTGMDGKIYRISQNRHTLFRYERASNSWNTILGNGIIGTCADGTLADTCSTVIDDAFIDRHGKIFFANKGQIRTIDQAGKVITLMGQGYSYGDGGPALAARFHSINSIGVWGSSANKKVVALDREEYRIREFTITESIIKTIAGNGTNSTANKVDVAAEALPVPTVNSNRIYDKMLVDPNTGDIYKGNTNRLDVLKRSLNRWQYAPIFGGTTDLYAPEVLAGVLGTQIKAPSYAPMPMAMTDDYILVTANKYVTIAGVVNYYSGLYLRYNRHTGIVDRFGGNNDHFTSSNSTTWCPDNTLLTSCNLRVINHTVRHNTWYWDKYDKQWIAVARAGSVVKKLNKDEPILTLATLPRSTNSLAYRRDSQDAAPILYYCSSGSVNRLYQYNLQTQSEQALEWPVSSLSCAGYDLIYDDERNSLFFPFRQNGLSGVAEYKLED